MKLKINCQEIEAAFGKLTGNVDLGLTLDLALIKPETIIALATTDANKVSELLKKHPAKLKQCVAKFVSGDLEKANSILKEIGGTEEDFIKAGGGGIGLVIFIIVIVMIASCPAK